MFTLNKYEFSKNSLVKYILKDLVKYYLIRSLMNEMIIIINKNIPTITNLLILDLSWI
jgi:hypothetical protein